MGAASLTEIAQQLSAPGKGLLASDESTPTIGRPDVETLIVQMPWLRPSCTSDEMLPQNCLWLHQRSNSCAALQGAPIELTLRCVR
jgi:hypothetical protein